MKKLGRLEIVPLREVWKKEPDFSQWLSHSDHLSLLGESLGIEMLCEETEADVGDFSADILAVEDGGNRRIIIENQFETTDHDHLGKLITYASGRQADILIWIVEKARDEHRAAVQWLNENTLEDIAVFLVQIEVCRIGDSDPAPRFVVLEKPNEWLKSAKSGKGHMTDREQKLQRWWSSFQDYAMRQPAYMQCFKRRKDSGMCYFDLPSGSSKYHIVLRVAESKGSISALIYINRDKELFQHFLSHRTEIESALGFELEWFSEETKTASTIVVKRPTDISASSQAIEVFQWYCDRAIALKRVFNQFAGGYE